VINAGAVKAFQQSTRRQLASGTLQNLGNAEWKLGRTGPAILAWERALWLDPFHKAARMDLRFARKTAQLETPDLAWYEVISTWLPANWWAWIAGVSLWLAVGMVMLPGILRLRKATWHQAVAAFCLMVFLLSIPAYVGLHTRSRIGFVLQPDTLLRLTPPRSASGHPPGRGGTGAPRANTRHLRLAPDKSHAGLGRARAVRFDLSVTSCGRKT